MARIRRNQLSPK